MNTFIANAKEKVLVEKAGMEKPKHGNPKWLSDKLYEIHLSNLRRIPAPFLTEGDEGKEKIEGRDFNLEYPCMDIYAPAGTKVTPSYKKGIPINGTSYDKDKIQMYLKEGEWYTVESIDVGSWSSTVELSEFPNIDFNTVCLCTEPIAVPLPVEREKEIKPPSYSMFMAGGNTESEKAYYELGYRAALAATPAKEEGLEAVEQTELWEQIGKEFVGIIGNTQWLAAIERVKSKYLITKK